MTIQEKLKALRAEMKKEKIDIYYIPTSDFHETEYVGDYFKCREYITGFTGSAGVAVICMDRAGLWTDGRYYIQAEKELEGEITLFKAGMNGVPKTDEYMATELPKGGCIGFDGRVVNAKYGERLAEKISRKNGTIRDDVDLIDRIWTDRPAMACGKVIDWPVRYSGRSREDKLSLIREKMREEGCDAHILSTLDNICWLLNLRGSDVLHFPVMQSFFVLEEDKAVLFVQTRAVDDEIREKLSAAGVELREYDEVYKYVSKLKAKKILMDKSKVNMRLVTSVPKKTVIVDKQNPEVIPQSIKNKTELANIKNAHIKDGIACTKFMYWLKKNIGKIPMTELSASDYLENLRRQQEGFLDLSFDTISAYGPNAAMMHYSATEESFAELKPEGFLLVDSGGHYLEGSTDITRTYALGKLTEKEKRYYTAVLQGNLRLGAAKFIYGCRGVNLDILARGPLWDMGADYRCGTGHGVGYCLNIHEAPNGFRWRIVEDRNDSCILEAGQVTTNEPGYYEEGAFGIRTENEMVCVELEENEYGKFMGFETITYSPIDMDPVIPEMLSSQEKNLINEYHKMVYNTLAPYFTGDELEFLKEVTKEVL